MEWYHRNEILRAQARVSILNREGPGWYLAEHEGGWLVRHDGRPPAMPEVRAAVCVEQVNRYRTRLVVKAV